MAERIAVVTGANRGLGLQCARSLAADGYRVVLAARTVSKAREAADSIAGNVFPMELDVSTDESVAAFFEQLEGVGPQVHVLINNAGVIPERDGGLETPPDAVAAAFNTNALGAFRLTQGLLPQMNAGGYGRVVMVSSGMGALSDSGSGHPAYRISKTAMNSVTRFFHQEARGNVKVNAVCPGWVRTDMGGANASRSVEEGAAGILWAATLPDGGPSGGFFRDGTAIAW
ncbi:MAG: SDR family NAD(P)-dependent oxidoreductase [Myxococcota bacterium]